MSDNYFDQFMIPDETDSNLNQFIIPTEIKSTETDDRTPLTTPFTPHEINAADSFYPLDRFGYKLAESVLEPVKLAETVALKISDLMDGDDEKAKENHRNQMLWNFAKNDFTVANTLPEATSTSDKVADFLGTAAGDIFNAYRLGIGGDATALGKSILEKTGGSLFGKAVAAGADNALLNMPQNVVNGLTDSVSPTDALKNIGSSELEDFAAGGLLGGALSALSKPIGALGKAADDTAIDNLLNDATKVDRTAIPVYNEGIGNELPDTREFSNSSESLLPETKISTIPDTLGGETDADTAIDRLFNDATKADNLSDEGAGDVASIAGIPKTKVDEILKSLPGSRPDPKTYLTKEYISDHLGKFSNGVTKIKYKAPTGYAGPPDGTFVMPSSVADDLIAKANGDISKLEQLLGLDPGSLGTNPVRIDIANPTGLRMPSGNEFGANDQWIPGGYTSGKIPEIIIDSPAPGQYIIRPLI